MRAPVTKKSVRVEAKNHRDSQPIHRWHLRLPPQIPTKKLPNPPPPSSSSKPLTSPSPSPTPSPPPPSYTSQSLRPSLTTKSPNPAHQIPKTQDPQSIPYPLASSGRAGFIPKPSFRPQSPDRPLTATNPGGFPSRSIRPHGFPPGDPQSQALHLMRPPMVHPSHLVPRASAAGLNMGVSMGMGMGMGGSVSAPIRGNPVFPPKVSALFPPSATDFNGYRDLRDTNRDDTVVTVNDRKVRLSDGDSLYALCRSWVRNGLPKETQPQFTEGVKLLPRPLPADASDKNGSGDEDDDKEEDVGSVDHLSARELLQIHVKRAKRVRARLRKERLRRIERYKQRLTLLLPSQVDYRNDTNRNDTNGG